MSARFAALAAFVAVWPSIAAAQDIGGRYKSEGTDPTGSRFSVTAEIEMLPENACRIKWSDGFSGICMLKDKTLAIAYLVYGKLGRAVYEVYSDGSIEGPFIDDFHGGGIGKGGKIGKERMIPIR